MEGKVPTPKGEINIYVNRSQIKISGATGTGVLRVKSKTTPTGNNISTVNKGSDEYEINIQPGKPYVISYTAM
jgi:hypothetical protein